MGTHRHTVLDPSKFPELAAVLTKAETAREFGIAVSTVELAIDRGNIAAVKCGGIWLVSRRTAVNFWTRRKHGVRF